jgi:hypothetical protein
MMKSKEGIADVAPYNLSIYYVDDCKPCSIFWFPFIVFYRGLSRYKQIKGIDN